MASDSMPSGSLFVSTDDALCALIWQCVMRARLPHLGPAVEVTFNRAVDVRPALNITKSYPGLMQNMTHNHCILQDLLGQPLGAVASTLRSNLDPGALAHNTRALATVMTRAADKSRYSFTATFDVNKDIMLSSWAKVETYDVDFGLGLGKPVSVRRPCFVPVEGLMYLLPKTPDDGIAAILCLGDEDMARLRNDEQFITYGKYIG